MGLDTVLRKQGAELMCTSKVRERRDLVSKAELLEI